MILHVEHKTLFTYDAPIYETAAEVRLQPASVSSGAQQCVHFNLRVDPDAMIYDYMDFYGNRVHHFNILHSHRQVEIVTTSVVETVAMATSSDLDADEILLMDLSNESRFIHFDNALEDFAVQFKGIDDAFRKATAICRCINESFRYEPGITDVHSTSSVVMALGKGVCQDFAHIMIATCRKLGLPARYVSGYLFGGGSTPEGQDEASHAWCEVYCGNPKGWVGFDPTHASLSIDERYIKIGSGRDYSDIPPVRGTWKGAASEHLDVSVRVRAMESRQADPVGMNP